MEGLKELLTYLTNQFKFWFIINEWQYGLQLRNGKIIRDLKTGFYLKIPFLDSVYSEHKRMRDIVISQINFTTKDDKQITASATAFFKVSDIREYYNGYAEPMSIIDGIIKNEMNRYFLTTRYEDFSQNKLEEIILSHIMKIKNKGITFSNFKLVSFSNARTYRIIADKLYSQTNSFLDDQSY